MGRYVEVSREEWLAARRELLAEEKAFTRARDELTARRRSMPVVKVDRDYRFRGEQGERSLADLFQGHSQLIVYHFMFGPDWEEGCPSCSFWADSYSGTICHLNARDIAFAVISRAPLEKLLAYRRRMGWDFDWYSSLESEFNFDFGVSFTPEQIAAGEAEYNFNKGPVGLQELPGISVFLRGDSGETLHSYSCYARGLDMLNSTYHHIDLTPRGRDEQDLPYPMAWLRRHDAYGD